MTHLYFDPSLFQNTGAVTVTDLMASPMAQGLFHRAIAASGTALNIWRTGTNSADVIKGALAVSQRAGCYDGLSAPDSGSIGRCMQSVPGLLLVTILDEYQLAERREGRLGFSVVSPVVQSFEMVMFPKFLREDPAIVFAEGREAPVPLMMSTTKHDGSNIMGLFYNRFLRDNGLDRNVTYLRYDLVPAALNALGVPDIPGGIHETISRTYLGDAHNFGNFSLMYPGLMDIFSVFSYKGDCYKTAFLHSRKTGLPTFWLSFEFRGNVSFWGQHFPGDVLPPFPGGVTHTDDLCYFFALTFLPWSDAEAATSSRMMSYWADFATVGRPHPDWPELKYDNEAYWIVDEVPSTGLDFPSKWVGPGYEAARPPV
ncbi:carboxylesterase 4A [Folsomia candida]|uniref:carboxylesterase 4A n=1 Tax=Folsomia candida TaxID=158441 RepID=UPI001604F37B|nr:carboxylesterase 4A [Folsomia candida]